MDEEGNVLTLIVYYTSADKTRGTYFQNVNTFKRCFFAGQASRHRYRCDFPRFSDVVLA